MAKKRRAVGGEQAGDVAELSPFFGEQDLHLWNEGNHYRAYRKLGAHLTSRDGSDGVHFAVWAPNAERLAVVGEFNDWDPTQHPLNQIGSSGVFEGFIPGLEQGAVYKYNLRSCIGGYTVNKADPFGYRHEVAPNTASVVWDLAYEWQDEDWLSRRKRSLALDRPISIYELHLGSWRRSPDTPELLLGYRELAPLLADYVEQMGFTHVELLPVMEHPFYGSWGYQTTGYFAATSRYGSPQDLMFLVDTLHQRGIGVIFDWVPSHFPTDEHSLAYFDGTHLFEHADRRQGHHPDWDSYVFNYGRHEVRSFLLSSALYWLDVFHADALRVDAVASMLYLDYSRQPDAWVPNRHGGRENLEAVAFLRRLNEVVYEQHPDVQTIAEESTAWPMVSKPLYLGGLGFGYKWDMGYMHDSLEYMALDPIHRKYQHHRLTFRRVYAYTENFVLALSHDEVVHGKGSLLTRMPGGEREQFANLRLLLGYTWAQPGKKLLFMGGEFGQVREWHHDRSLDWHLLEQPQHAGLQTWLRDLNRFYRDTPALHELDHQPEGFEWIDCHDSEQGVISLLRRGRDSAASVLVVFNLTPVLRSGYRVGVPTGGLWTERLNSDASAYGGGGVGNLGAAQATAEQQHGRPNSLLLTLPPLAALFFVGEGQPAL